MLVYCLHRVIMARIAKLKATSKQMASLAHLEVWINSGLMSRLQRGIETDSQSSHVWVIADECSLQASMLGLWMAEIDQSMMLLRQDLTYLPEASQPHQ